MLHNKLVNPHSIVIVGGSNDIKKPGGKIVSNIKESGFKGSIFIVHPKEKEVQGIHCCSNISALPNIDLAVLAIPANACAEVVETLAEKKNTRGFIIISSGFSEVGKNGAVYEQQIKDIVNRYHGSLIGPNCIGVINKNYSAVFTLPVPVLNAKGCDLISSSGATAVFIIESALPKGLNFSNIYSAGNSAQTCAEDILVSEFERMMHIEGAKAVLLQPMLSGTELFIGAKYEPNFGHIIMCGMGGIFVEVLGDVASGLVPISYNEAHSMIRSLKSYKIIQGMRGQKCISEDKFAEIIVRLSTMLRYAVEIKEVDINPLIANEMGIIVVDARILVEK